MRQSKNMKNATLTSRAISSDFDELAVLLGFLNPLRLYLLQETLLVLVQRLHVETDIHLGLGLGGDVWHRHIADKAMLGQHLRQHQTGLLSLYQSVAEQTLNFLWGME